MSVPTDQVLPSAPGWLRRTYRQWRGFPWWFCLTYPAAMFGGVMTGPFAGMRLGLRNSWSQAPTLLLGSYERELHPIWAQLVAEMAGRSAKAWIIGAAEGYYVCGLARRCPKLRLAAFEADASSRNVLRGNLRRNEVQDRVEVLGKFDGAHSNDLFRGEPPQIIVSDIEGGENEIFTEEILRSLKQTVLIIEVHPGYELLGCTGALALTHQVRIVEPVPRTEQDYPIKDKTSPEWRLRWMDERRPFSTPWLVAIPRAADQPIQ